MKALAILITSLFIFSCASTTQKKEAITKDTKDMTDTVKKTTAPATKEAQKKKASVKKIPKETLSTATTCKIKGDTRKIAVATPANGSCKVHYTKFGNENVVATARNDISHCKKIFTRIKGKLETAGFTCE